MLGDLLQEILTTGKRLKLLGAASLKEAKKVLAHFSMQSAGKQQKHLAGSVLLHTRFNPNLVQVCVGQVGESSQN